MNGHYLRELPVEQLTARLEAFTGRSGLRGAVEISREKIQTLADFWPLAGFFFDGPGDDEKAWRKTFAVDGAVDGLGAARDALAALEPFTQETVETTLRGLLEANVWKPKHVFQPIRVAIAGTTISPGIFESVALLGRDETVGRIDAALARVRG